VALWAPNDYAYAFVVDASGTLWNTSLMPNASGTWDSLGGMCTSSPAAICWNSINSNTLRFDVFVRGSDGALWHKYYNNSVWSGWQSLGGQLASGTGPAVSSWSAGRLDVFVEGTNGALYHKWWDGKSWSGWQNLGGKLTASPAATSPGLTTGLIDVFVRGANGAVWWKSYNNSWSSWKSLGGQVAANTGPAVTSFYDLFVQGTASALAHVLWRGRDLERLQLEAPRGVIHCLTGRRHDRCQYASFGKCQQY